MPNDRRSLRESAKFQEQCGQLAVDIKRLDEITEGARWAAIEGAEFFPEVPQTPFRRIAIAATEDTPSLRVYFSIQDDGFVDFVWLEVVADDPDEPVD